MKRFMKECWKMFLHLIDTAMYNSHVLHQTIQKDYGHPKKSFGDYRIDLAEEMLQTVTLHDYKTQGRPSQECSSCKSLHHDQKRKNTGPSQEGSSCKGLTP
jgi:hypothetical protein